MVVVAGNDCQCAAAVGDLDQLGLAEVGQGRGAQAEGGAAVIGEPDTGSEGVVGSEVLVAGKHEAAGAGAGAEEHAAVARAEVHTQAEKGADVERAAPAAAAVAAGDLEDGSVEDGDGKVAGVVVLHQHARSDHHGRRIGCAGTAEVAGHGTPGAAVVEAGARHKIAVNAKGCG